ncbi:amino acid ABC transporter permease [Brevibacillus nitrificans]|uniref:Amino acid ABC transporter permease n=1 Tax=Brevibacillus nitrificans TaxID=651560 RepID=A0A3M8DLI0_9BACL|nr:MULTISPECIES: amino acid ABC transporter permease [Brevibacillus]MED1950960.1 amino acid ABC transporter permease [Brevibacillus centrosporus]RNB88903.1 amino acid ABC transporter permease [Brevibacillus nitrificans]
MTYDWSVIPENLDLFLEGIWLTLEISLFSLVLSIPIGILAGLLRVSNKKGLSLLASAYVEFIRGVPLLVLLIWIYFVMGKVLKLGEYWSAVIGLAFFSGAFIAEIVRAGIQAVPRGQMEAARSSGMSYLQAMKLIILPQAFRRVLPPMASQFIILIKDSSLVSTISVIDLTLVGKNLVATTFRSLEVWTFIALIYFVITFSLSQLIGYLERKYRVVE